MKKVLVLVFVVFGISVSALSVDCGEMCDDKFWKSATVESVQELLSNGADVNANDGLGGTPLHWAATIADGDIISVLINADAKINATDENGWTPLELAIFFGPPDSIIVLWLAGAKINANSLIEWNALHLAALLGSPESIYALLSLGVDGSHKNEAGETPFDLARFNKRILRTKAYWVLRDEHFSQR